MSVSATNIENAILLGSTNIPVNQITPLGSFPVTCAWCVAQFGQQDVVYVATQSWANETTPLWSIDLVNVSNGAVSAFNLNQPG